MTPNQQIIVNVAGVLVAALVGTLIGGYLASRNNANISREITGWERRVAYFLKVKNEIFTPIYNDLVRFMQELTSGGKDGWQPWKDDDYWWASGLGVEVRDIDKEPPWYCPSFVEWNKIKNVPDLYIQVPEEVKERLDNFLHLLDEYNRIQKAYYSEVAESMGLCLSIRTGRQMFCWESKYIGSRAIVRDRESIFTMCQREIGTFTQLHVSDEQVYKDVDEFIDEFSQDGRIKTLKSMSPVIIKETDSLVAFFYDQIRGVIHTYELGESDDQKGSWLFKKRGSDK